MSIVPKTTVAEYDRLIAEGYFEDPSRRRMELIFGEVQAMSPIGPDHEYLVDRLNLWSVKTVSHRGVLIRIQHSIRLPELDSAPQPDVVWVRDREYFSERPRSEDVLLVIEVAASSLAKDRGEKASLYATAGIVDYWVVHVEDECIEELRDPLGGTYRTIRFHGSSEMVHPLSFPDIGLSVGELFRRSQGKG